VASCNLDPVTGETKRYGGTDPVTGEPIPLICSNFDAHKIDTPAFFKF
jgi:hypothetical protein